MAAMLRVENQLACVCCLHVDDLFSAGTPEFLEKFKKIVKSQFTHGHEDVKFDAHWTVCQVY